MAAQSLSRQARGEIRDAVEHFLKKRHLFELFAEGVVSALQGDEDLRPYIQQIKYRLKSEARLKTKLERKAAQRSRSEAEPITKSNLFRKINDLAGIRILHLHTTQFAEIHRHVTRIASENKIRIVEGPTAHCWDNDHEDFFKRLGITTARVGPTSVPGDTMYASVHYILEANQTERITCELQVRTLADEIWGQVSHRVEYEGGQADGQVHDMLKVLARLTSASTRLVDCIFEVRGRERRSGRYWQRRQ
ncbi:MAG: hypothetical protein ACP5I8_15400 [Phycisphaerae bacterium]